MNDLIFFNYFSEPKVQGAVLEYFSLLDPDLTEETDFDCEQECERALFQMNSTLVSLFPALILTDTHIIENEEFP